MLVKELLAAVDALAPFALTMDFDNTGLLVGDGNAEVTGVVLALDCSDDIMEKAKELGANLIISHHPVIFSGMKRLCADSVVYQLIRNNMHVISAHTNLDIAEGGVNDCLCKALGLQEISGLTATDEEHFLGRVGLLPAKLSAEELAAVVKGELNTVIRYTDGGKPISKVAVCGGAGDSELESAIACGADALISGEVKHHIFIEAAHRGFTLLEAGHHHTEAVVLAPLCEKLQAQFPQIPFTVCGDGVVKSL